MSQFNVLNRYLFNDAHARGELVQLESSFKSIIKNLAFKLIFWIDCEGPGSWPRAVA